MNNELVPQPNWLKRNWKWALPLGGCLTLIIGLVVLFGSLFWGITNVMEDSQPYEYAIELINQDEELMNILGSPIEKDGVIQGNINWINGDKSAKMVIPISGSKGNGSLFIDASGKADEWIYHEIRVEVNEQEFDFLESTDTEY